MKRVIRKTGDGESYKLTLMLDQDFNNVGLYTPTNGDIGQLDVLCNFVLKTNSTNNSVIIKDGVDPERYRFMKGLTYSIDWGDNNVSVFNADGQPHNYTYSDSGEYVITMTITTPWGNHKEVKTINIPSVDEVTFNINVTTPELLGYDSEMVAYVNNSGVIICDGVPSRLKEVVKYGQSVITAYITDQEGMNGVNGISQATGNVYTYYIDRLKYMDDNQTGITTLSLYPNNFTNGDVIEGIEYINEMLNVYDGPMVHQEVFNGVTGDIDIQSDIFIERGKQAPFEFYYKLGEITNMKELEQNGNKFFTINNVDDFKL